MTISTDDVRTLLQAETNSVLVLIEGRTAVITDAERDSDEYLGALQIITRDELLQRAGSAEPTDHEIAELAGALDVGATELGA
jgi:hypothetical protein